MKTDCILQQLTDELKKELQLILEMKSDGTIFKMGHLFSTNKNNYYYDTGTGKVVKLDDTAYCLFDRLFDSTFFKEPLTDYIKSMSISELTSILSIIRQEKLFKRPDIKNFGEDIKKVILYKHNKVEQLILEVTEKCNFRCKYCIFSSDYAQNREFGMKNMSFEIAKKAIDYAIANSGDTLSVTFYGGEPLINYPLIKKCIEYTIEVANGKELFYSLTSNMSLMTQEISEYLAGIPNLGFLASIDGPQEVHDACRVYANDKATFQDSMRGLEILCKSFAKANKIVNINAVLTSPSNFEKLDSINCFFESLSFLPDTAYISISYAARGSYPGTEEYFKSISHNPRYEINGYCNPLLKWQKLMAKEHGVSPENTKNIYYTTLLKSLVRIQNRLIADEPTSSRGLNGCCVPGVRRLFVSTDGEFKPCERIGTCPSMGDVDGGLNYEKIAELYAVDYANMSYAECNNCWAYNLCSVCYAGVYSEKGLDYNLKSDACVGCRSNLLIDLALYHEMAADHPESLEFLKDIKSY